MSFLLSLSRLIDRINERVGRSVLWLVLIAVLISAGNAIVRKLFNTSSNALLEVQWYLFAAIFMLAAGYTLLRNEHVRIDILSSRLSPKGRNWVDIFGIVFFLLLSFFGLRAIEQAQVGENVTLRVDSAARAFRASGLESIDTTGMPPEARNALRQLEPRHAWHRVVDDD